MASFSEELQQEAVCRASEAGSGLLLPVPTLPVPQHASPRPSSTIFAASPYFCRTISRTSSRSIILISSMVEILSLATVVLSRARIFVQIGGERVDGLVVHAADHVLAASLHGDQAREAQLLQMEGDLGVDLLCARDTAADL